MYAQLSIPDPFTGRTEVRRVALEGAATVPQAVIKLQELQKGRRDKALPILRQTPKFSDYAAQYFRYYELVKDAKRPSTLRTERFAITHWDRFLGHVRLARKEAGLRNVRFHDCRHFFISYCVMSGIDYMTIAKWVGHQDGGFLIGKVYGHLSNEHARRQAQRVSFRRVVLEAAESAWRSCRP